jgi:hypothetical protein
VLVMQNESGPSLKIDVAVFGGIENGYGNGDLTSELLNAKAAVLYADHVSIQTYRSIFLLSRMTNQVRTVKKRLGGYVENMSNDDRDALLARISKEIHTRENTREAGTVRASKSLEKLINSGMTVESILDLPDLIADLVAEKGAQSVDSAPFFHGLAEMAVERWVDFKPDERPRSAIQAIKDLNYLHEQGLVSIDPGDPSPMWLAPTDAIPSVMFDLIARLVDEVSRSSAEVSPFVNRGFQAFSGELLNPVERLETAAIAGPPGTAIASALLTSLPNFNVMPVDELVDLRKAVSPSLARFRAAMVDFQQQLDAGKSEGKPLRDRIEELRLKTVEPELEELRQTLRENGLMSTVARGTPLTASGVVGLGVSAALGGPLVAGITAVAAGVSTAIAQEFLKRRGAEGDRQKHRLYLLWQADMASRAHSPRQNA